MDEPARKPMYITIPTALTLFRIVLVPLIIVFVISSDRVRVLIAAGIFVAASLTWLRRRAMKPSTLVPTNTEARMVAM